MINLLTAVGDGLKMTAHYYRNSTLSVFPHLLFYRRVR